MKDREFVSESMLEAILEIYKENGIVTSYEVESLQSRPFAIEAGKKVDNIVEEFAYTEEFHSPDWSAYSHAIYNTEMYTREEARSYMVSKGLIE